MLALWWRCSALTDWELACGCDVGDLRRCPLAVASEFGMLRRTFLEVKRGNCRGPFMYPRVTAFKKVDGGGLPSEAWTNLICSASVCDD